MIEKGDFCEDFFYCLNVFLIENFLLSECVDDIFLFLKELMCCVNE